MNATIQPATKQDIPAIAALERALFSVPWTEGMIRGELENPLAQFLLLRLFNKLGVSHCMNLLFPGQLYPHCGFQCGEEFFIFFRVCGDFLEEFFHVCFL